MNVAILVLVNDFLINKNYEAEKIKKRKKAKKKYQKLVWSHQ